MAFADAEGNLVLCCVYMWMKGIKYLLYRAERPDASLLQRLLVNGKSGSAAIHYFVSGMKFGYGIYYVFNKKKNLLFLPGCNVLSITVGFSVFNTVVPPGKEIMHIMIHGTPQRTQQSLGISYI